MSIIRLKPLKNKRNSWSGVTRYKKCQDSIAPYWNSRGVVETGLSDEDLDFLKKHFPERDLNPTSAFWHEFRVIMDDKEREFDTSNPEHYLIYKFLLKHKRVANSVNELENFPYAEYVIADEREEAKKVNVQFNAELEAFKEFAKLTPEDMRNILKLYPGNAKYGNADPDIIQAKLGGHMKSDPAGFLAIVQDKFKDSKIFIKDLVDNKILRKNKQAYYYGEDPIGHDLESTVTYINDPNNQALKVALKQALEAVTIKRKK